MFRQDKSTQMAAQFLQLAGGRMPYIALLKLLYLADKEMLLRWGKPVTYDRWVSMRKGPVLSATYDLIKAPDTRPTYWNSHIQTVDHEVRLVDAPGSDALSQAEDAIIAEVFQEHGSKDRWDLVDLTHELPEWSDPGSGTVEITYADVLKVEGLSAEEIRDTLDNIAAQDVTAHLVGTP